MKKKNIKVMESQVLNLLDTFMKCSFTNNTFDFIKAWFTVYDLKKFV